MDILPNSAQKETPRWWGKKTPSGEESDEAVDSNGSSWDKEETITTSSGKKALWFYQLVFVNLDLQKSWNML